MLTTEGLYSITVPPTNKMGVTVGPPNLNPKHASRKRLDCQLQEELKSAPLVVLIKYPNIIDTCSPVNTPLQALTLASLNICLMVEIHVAKNQLPSGKILHVSCCRNPNKENIPWHDNLFFVYEGLPHVMRTLLWEACSHSLDSGTDTCDGMGLPTCRLQSPLRAPLFWRSILGHVSSMLSTKKEELTKYCTRQYRSACGGGKRFRCYCTPLPRNSQ